MDNPGFDPSAVARDGDGNVSTTCLLKEVIMTRLSDLQTCKESMPAEGRVAYSVFVLCFQFLLPMITLSAAYYQVLKSTACTNSEHKDLEAGSTQILHFKK